jgi:hypothetical protein
MKKTKNIALDWDEYDMKLFFSYRCSKSGFDSLFNLPKDNSEYYDYRNKLRGLPLSDFLGDPKTPIEKIKEIFAKKVASNSKSS